MDTTTVSNKELCVRLVHIMADGAFEDFETLVHPEARNREDVDEPPATRGRGPAAFYATALWLRDAYAELRWTPPSPLYLVRMLLATRRARREAGR